MANNSGSYNFTLKRNYTFNSAIMMKDNLKVCAWICNISRKLSMYLDEYRDQKKKPVIAPIVQTI